MLQVLEWVETEGGEQKLLPVLLSIQILSQKRKQYRIDLHLVISTEHFRVPGKNLRFLS